LKDRVRRLRRVACTSYKTGIFFAEPVTGEMVIVKNLDAATVTVEKLTELFPDAEDITISSHPQATYLGKLKG